MPTVPSLSKTDRDHLERLVRFLKPATEDPTYLVLKAHLLAEEVPYRFIESQAHRPGSLSDARLGFAQLVALRRSFNPYSKEDWWGWAALKKIKFPAKRIRTQLVAEKPETSKPNRC